MAGKVKARKKARHAARVFAPKPAAKAGAILGKTPADYWKLAGVPLGVLVAWSLITFLSGLVSALFVMITAPIGLLLALAGGVYIGWMNVKRFDGGVLQSALAGGVVGLANAAVAGALAVIQTFWQGNVVAGGVAIGIEVVGAVWGFAFLGVVSLVAAFIAENF